MGCLPVNACVFSVHVFAASLDNQKPPTSFPTFFVIATTFYGCKVTRVGESATWAYGDVTCIILALMREATHS